MGAEIDFSDSICAAEYNELRECAGFAPLTARQAEQGLRNTTFLSAARHGGRIVGMGRVLFDFGYTAYVGDVIVRPEYQRQGIGSEIMRSLMQRTLDAVPPGEKIMFVLAAAKGREPFYEKLGFVRRPSGSLGHGMSVCVEKQTPPFQVPR